MANNYSNKGISSLIIRIIGILTMIWSFAAKTNIESIHNSALSDCMYWFSYTLFAFLLAEGVYNTSNKLLYIIRFAVFTIISEFAYDYYTFGKFFSLKGQSIMLTLFICLCIMMFCDYIRRRFKNIILDIVLIITLSILFMRICTLINCSFSKYGILIAMLFYVSRNLSYPKLMQIACMAYYTYMVSTETIITVIINKVQYNVPIAIFAILALFVTWFYNEERGKNSIALKIIFYLMYPLILMTFALLNNFVLV